MRYGYLGVFLWLLYTGTAAAQVRDSSLFAYPIQLDELVVRAQSSGWDLDGFIRRVKEDTSFYKAFKTLRLVPYEASHDFQVRNQAGQPIARYEARTRQYRQDGCRSMEWLDQQVQGKFFKSNGDYRYYTASLYDHLFFTEGRVCGEDNLVGPETEPKGKGRMEKHKDQLKQIMFNPGSRTASIPFLGDRTRLFEAPLADYYDYSLRVVLFEGTPCYVFEAIVKPPFADRVVYQQLTTWFDQEHYRILKRNYHIQYETLIYDFDVKIEVEMTRYQGELVPRSMTYDGDWHILGRKRERVGFKTRIHYD